MSISAGPPIPVLAKVVGLLDRLIDLAEVKKANLEGDTEYARLRIAIERREAELRTQQPGTERYEHLCAETRALRDRLAETPEQKRAVAAWLARRRRPVFVDSRSPA